jgi:hypothetical protein
MCGKALLFREAYSIFCGYAAFFIEDIALNRSSAAQPPEFPDCGSEKRSFSAHRGAEPEETSGFFACRDVFCKFAVPIGIGECANHRCAADEGSPCLANCHE